MSRTIRGGKAPGSDFWSRRSHDSNGSGVVAKKITKKRERSENSKLERQALCDPENVRGRIPGE